VPPPVPLEDAREVVSIEAADGIRTEPQEPGDGEQLGADGVIARDPA
jgi:hypothetical protein